MFEVSCGESLFLVCRLGDDLIVMFALTKQSAAIDAKILQQSKELREQFDVKAEHQLAVINAKIENQMMRIEDITSKIEQKYDQKVIGLEQKLSCEVDKLKQKLEETKKINSTPVCHVTAKTLKVPAFDGETFWNIYKAQFEATVMNYGLNESEWARALVFLKAVRDSDLRQTLILVVKRSLKDAVAYSLTFESAKQASKTDVKLRQICEKCSCQKMVLEQKGQDYGAPKCWNCGEKGHLRRDCKQTSRNNYCRHCAATWHKRNLPQTVADP
ncbi:hypothetical protein HELRODRAFT_182130 [Helobdella robusta]|uniref:CCHC-type domain-containing protein n=1 Tax=Helobdella robusta TaxID=6412 RepID=T1FHT3_HELRO|nr:hypothetical protein HELRODRAFT_182130 [Helobdella robusta]ESN91273.1 hypothetical protein HELRODRAFT_182130 [Helobdella robusta]